MSDQARINDDEPPFSRVFVACPRDCSEQQLTDIFSRIGPVQYIKVVRDRTTNEPKGVVYVKYPLASLAAAAIEALNGTRLSEDGLPIKVALAEPKGAPRASISRDAEDTPPRSRLYVVCSKNTPEEELANIFRPFGDMEYCRLLRDRTTQEPKGCAYVKYAQSSAAMKAIEAIQASPELSASLRVVIAEPKAAPAKGGVVSSYRGPERRDYIEPRSGYMGPHTSAPAVPQRDALVAQLAMLTKGLIDQYAPGEVPPQLQQFSQQLLSAPLVAESLGSMPANPLGVPMSAPVPGGSDPSARLYVVCSKAVAHEYLVRLFSQYPGMEYVDLKYDRNTGESKGFAYVGFRTLASAHAARQLDGSEFPPGSGHPLKVVFAEPPRGKEGAAGGAPSAMSDVPMFASAAPAQPSDNSRLFAVLSRPVPSDPILWEIFNQFPGLEYVRIQPGKNYGYVKYANAAAATHAMYYLNGAETNSGSKITLKVADPPPASSGDFESRKRQRT